MARTQGFRDRSKKQGSHNPTQQLQDALALHQQGKLAEAEKSYAEILTKNPKHFHVLHLLGLISYQTRRSERAVDLISKAIEINPTVAAAHNNCGVALRDLRQLDEALASFDKAISLEPHFAEAFCNRGSVLQDLERHEDALASYEKAISLKSGYVEAYNNRGNVLQDLKRLDEAIASYDKAISLKPDHAEAYGNRGNALKNLKRLEEALTSYDKALSLKPDLAKTHNNRGIALQDLERLEEALVSYDKAISLSPDYARAFSNRGSALQDLKRLEDALASYDKAITLKPDYPEAYSNRGNVLQDLKRLDEAIASYDKAISLKPDYAEAYSNRGNALQDLKRLEEALISYDKALSLKPDYRDAYSNPAAAPHLRQKMCDWDRYNADCIDIRATVDSGSEALPFILRTVSPSLSELRLAALSANRRLPAAAYSRFDASLRGGPPNRLRIGYISSDYCSHPVGNLIVGVLERHDRKLFHVHGYGTGPDDDSALRRRIVGTFERFVDVTALSNAEAANCIRADGIDILVDLNGFTRGARRKILALRPAPVQVNALGYLGPMGASFIDYVIADPVVVPISHQPYYDERIVHLRHCYLPVAPDRPIAWQMQSRQDFGLPLSGFVFCCFNNPYKITPAIFDIWMRLLAAVSGSVLWLHASNPPAVANLRAEAAVRGIQTERLVFAPTIPRHEYLARFRHADLFLDTLPCSACTTGADALLAGLPILTCTGDVFAGRHASSLLHAAGLPELVTTSLSGYEDLALRLASQPGLLAALRQRLETASNKVPLFNITSFVHDLEAIYQQMASIYRNREQPRTFVLSK